MLGQRPEERNSEERGRTDTQPGQWLCQESVRTEENPTERSPRCPEQAGWGAVPCNPLIPGPRERHQQRTRCPSVQGALGERSWFLVTEARWDDRTLSLAICLCGNGPAAIAGECSAGRGSEKSNSGRARRSGTPLGQRGTIRATNANRQLEGWPGLTRLRKRPYRGKIAIAV